MIDLTYLGHAGWMCESDDFKCVFDPWSNTSGAFFDSWYPFPDNSNIDFPLKLSNLDFVYISHAHDDHLVEQTLNLIDKSTLILLSDFRDPTALEKIKKLNFKNIRIVRPDEQLEIKDVKIKIFNSEGALESDSCILLEKENYKILNLNDCHIEFSKIKSLVGEVDIVLLQSSNAIWWPCNYDYEEEVKNNYGKIKRNNLLKRSLKYCQTLNAKMAIPNAGPPIFKNKTMERWNFNRDEEWNPFCTSKFACEYFLENNINSNFMMPGEKINTKTLMIEADNEFRKEVYDNLDKYTKKYLLKLRKNNQRVNFIKKKEELDKYFQKFKKQVNAISKISNIYCKKIDFKTLIEFSNTEKWILDFENNTEPFQEYSLQEYRYHFKLNKFYLPLIMKERTIDFETLFLSGDFVCKRDPDIFNETLFTVFKNFDSRRLLISEQIFAENSNLKDELFILEHDNCKYEVQKYCPHMYADLEEIGYVDDEENFVCPLHGWKFDLDSGDCPGKKEKLKIKRLK